MGTSGNRDSHFASRSVLNDFIGKALTISAGSLSQNVRYVSVCGKRGLSGVVDCWSMIMTSEKEQCMRMFVQQILRFSDFGNIAL